jgi:parallel beta-helix repeat protein
MAIVQRNEGYISAIRWLLATGSLVVGAATAPARASTLSCGDSLPAGLHAMDSDLVCSSATSAFGLELTSGAELRMRGHSITFDVGGAGEGIRMTGTGAQVSGGRIFGTGTGIRVQGGGHRVTGMAIDHNNFGILLDGSDGNALSLSAISGNFAAGVEVRNSSHNFLAGLTVNDQAGTSFVGGIELFASSDNVIVLSQVSRNACNGITVFNSSRNTIRYNAVDDNRCPASQPAANIAVFGASVANVIRNNSLSSSAPGMAADGINVGCKDGCAFQGQTTGADNNIVSDNVAQNNDRYGIARATGNAYTPGVYEQNIATGNRAADFALDP